MSISRSRYQVAYQGVRATVRAAKILRALGIITAIAVLIGGFAASMQNGAIFFVGLIAAVLIAFFSIAIYTILAAQAQLIAAVVDTAINTSTLLQNEQKEDMIEDFE